MLGLIDAAFEPGPRQPNVNDKIERLLIRRLVIVFLFPSKNANKFFYESYLGSISNNGSWHLAQHFSAVVI